MNFPTTDKTRLHVTAEIQIEGTNEPISAGLVEESDLVTLSGRVTHARTGTALPGVRILALENAAAGYTNPLGSCISDTDGRFHIQFDDKPDVRERLLVLRRLPNNRLYFRVETSEGQLLYTSDPMALDRAYLEVTLAVPIAETSVAASTWAALGQHLQQARIGRLNEVVRLLSGEGVIGTKSDQKKPSSSIPMLTRHAMLDQMEQAFLDPTGILHRVAAAVPTIQELHDPEQAQSYIDGLQAHLTDHNVHAALSDMLGKAASFANLAEVDWVIDPMLFENGDFGGAINKFSDHYKFNDTPLHRETDLTLYRDYLLAIWTTYATKIVYVSPNHLTEKQALAQLETRFHQNFRTFDEKPRNANTVLIQIVRTLLSAPKGKGFGFGVAAASIAAQGTRAPRVYLDELISLSHVSPTEMGLRYRLDLTRADAELSNPVQENIATLQGFFRDSFQCDLDPDHVDPDILDQPIIPDRWIGNAPFFLYYDEWLRQRAPFYPENYLDIRRVLPIDLWQQGRDHLVKLAAGTVDIRPLPKLMPEWKFCLDVLAMWDKLQAGHAHFYAGEYELALTTYQQVIGADWSLVPSTLSALYNKRKKLPLNNLRDLQRFMDPAPLFSIGAVDYVDTPPLEGMALRLAYYTYFTIPVCLGDAEFALGRYEQAVFHYGQATRFLVGVARESDSGGYRPPHFMGGEFEMYFHGDKPFTVRLLDSDVPGKEPYPAEIDDRRYDDLNESMPKDGFPGAGAQRIPHLAEIRYCRLRQTNVMLEWADALYRLNEPTNMARARELYKGVLWLHGKVPPICPTWPQRFSGGGGQGDVFHVGGVPPTYMHDAENPALISQVARSYRGIYQIDHGFNYYGERDNIVPILRYRPLKNAADRMAAKARAAQQDFLQYTERIEASITSGLQLSNFLQKTKLQKAITDEQHAIAEHDVAVAQEQVAAVEAAIKAKQDEIAKHDSLLGQIGDAIKGAKSIYEDIPDDTKSAVGAGVKSEATGKALVGEGMLGLGASASVMTGIGIFAAVGYVTLSGMSDAANQRMADLSTLTDKGLPAAKAAVVARQHGVTIAGYQQQIAQADVDLASTLLAFEQNRLLNRNFWLQLAQIARRLLRRYLELGARMAWLTERALAYEQDRLLQIVRMDYFPARLQGVTGADLMQADLAELDATWIEGMKRTVPVRRTLSLAREFPLQYGQLKQTGRCSFRTEEAFFRRAYPGTRAYRLRAVSAAIQQVDFTQPLRGSLINRGISISKPQQPGEHVLVRPGESLPLSEFRLENDMAIYGLPNETLLTFEGSNVETFWELGFPKAANATGLSGLVDVLLTFDLFCEFAPESYEADLVNLPTAERKWILISAAQYQPGSLADLAGAVAKVDVVFDLRRLRLLPQQERSRKIKNVAVYVTTPDKIDFTAKLLVTDPATSVTVTFKEGFAISTLQPDPAMPPLPASPLNALADMNPEQAFTLSFNKTANPGVDFHRVTDVVLAIEYETSLV